MCTNTTGRPAKTVPTVRQARASVHDVLTAGKPMTKKWHKCAQCGPSLHADVPGNNTAIRSEKTKKNHGGGTMKNENKNYELDYSVTRLGGYISLTPEGVEEKDGFFVSGEDADKLFEMAGYTVEEPMVDEQLLVEIIESSGVIEYHEAEQ